jgi:hypothetical protein
MDLNPYSDICYSVQEATECRGMWFFQVPMPGWWS